MSSKEILKQLKKESWDISKLRPPFGEKILCDLSEVSLPGLMMKRICKTEYKYVYVVAFDGLPTYRAELAKYRWSKCFPRLRDAALAVDKKLIEMMLPPVNILVKR
jgi:hypothetical protein